MHPGIRHATIGQQYSLACLHLSGTTAAKADTTFRLANLLAWYLPNGKPVTLGRQSAWTACRFLASARIKIYWMSPEYGSTASDLPPETQFLLLELAPKGPYAILLPLIDSGKFRATLRPPR